MRRREAEAAASGSRLERVPGSHAETLQRGSRCPRIPPNPRGGLLSAPHVVACDYRRSVGPVLGRFFIALRDRRLVGSATADGRVLVPPMEYDPESRLEGPGPSIHN